MVGAITPKFETMTHIHPVTHVGR